MEKPRSVRGAPRVVGSGPPATSATAPPVALSIAGSDSGAGAGCQADLKTFSALGVYGTTVLTAVTSQGLRGVRHAAALAPELVDSQLRAVTGDFCVRAVKTGMLATGAIVEQVAAYACEGLLPNLVVDPVLAASGGEPLADAAALCAYREGLLPHATVVTPNLAEASALLDMEVDGVRSMREAARRLLGLGVRAAVVTGGHLPGDQVIDVVAVGDQVAQLEGARVATTNDHGSGCTFSAAVAAHLALGHPPLDAVAAARRYVTVALEGARRWQLGPGRGPLAHFAGQDPVVSMPCDPRPPDHDPPAPRGSTGAR